MARPLGPSNSSSKASKAIGSHKAGEIPKPAWAQFSYRKLLEQVANVDILFWWQPMSTPCVGLKISSGYLTRYPDSLGIILADMRQG